MKQRSSKFSVCFVCLGNICRSPTAEGVMRDLVQRHSLLDNFIIDSAGTIGYHAGSPADARASKTAKRHGVELTSISRQFVVGDFDRFDLVLAMDKSNLNELKTIARDDTDRKKLALFRNFDPQSPPDADTPDPYYGSGDGFEEVFEICQAACRGILDYAQSKKLRT